MDQPCFVGLAIENNIRYIANTVGLPVQQESLMQGETKERWIQLCEQAASEQDSQKLIKLIDEIFRLLEEKRSRVSKKEADEMAGD